MTRLTVFFCDGLWWIGIELAPFSPLGQLQPKTGCPVVNLTPLIGI